MGPLHRIDHLPDDCKSAKGDFHAARPERGLLGPRPERRRTSSSWSRRPSRRASTRCGPRRRTARTRRRCWRGWRRRPTQIQIGSAIFQMPGRSPAMTAMTAATLDQLSGGRMLLGIGTSGPQVAEGWHGQRFAKQLARTREYVEILRMALARERVVYDGRDVPAAAAGRPRQGAEADDRAGAGADPDLHRGDRAEEHEAHRRDRGRLAAGVLLARARGRVARAARGGRGAGGPRAGDGLRHRADRERGDRRRRGPRARPDAATSSRCTWAAWARARRTSTTSSCSATGSRTPRARSRTCTSTARRTRPPRRSRRS